MRLQQGLDLLHRRVEEWSEEAMMASEEVTTQVEGFVEYATDLVAGLHELVEEMEAGDEEMGLTVTDVTSRELCEVLWTTLHDAWEFIEFAERPVFEVEDLNGVLAAVAVVLDMPAEESDEELEEAIEMLDEFLVEAF